MDRISREAQKYAQATGKSSTIVTVTSTGIDISLRPGYVPVPLKRHRLKPDEIGYIDITTMSIGDVVENLTSRNCKGARVLQPDVLPGGAALAWDGFGELTEPSVPGVPLVVGLRDPKKLTREQEEFAATIYARPSDQLGVGARMKSGRTAAKTFAVMDDRTYPPFKNSMGSSMMIRRNLGEQMKTLGQSDVSLQSITLADWGLAEEHRELLEGVVVQNENPLRALITSSTRFYASRTMSEVSKGLGSLRIVTARDSVRDGDNHSINHAALEVLGVSVVSLVLRRNPEFCIDWRNTAKEKRLGFHYTSDALGHVELPDRLDTVFDDFVVEPPVNSEVNSSKKAAIIQEWWRALSDARRTLEESARMEKEDQMDQTLDGAIYTESVEVPRSSFTIKRKSSAIDHLTVLSNSTFRAQARRSTMRLTDAARDLPLGYGVEGTSAVRVAFFMHFATSKGLCSTVTRQVKRSDRQGQPMSEKISPTGREIIAGCIPSDLENTVRKLLTARGVDDVSGIVDRLKDGDKRVTLTSCYRKKVNSLSEPRVLLWLVKTAFNVGRRERTLANSPLSQILYRGITDVCMDYLRGKLQSWAVTLSSESKLDEKAIREFALRGTTPSGTTFYSLGEELGEVASYLPYETHALEVDPSEFLSEYHYPKARGTREDYYRYLSLRQQVALSLSTVDIYAEGFEVKLTLNGDKLLARYKESLKKRIKNMERRWEKAKQRNDFPHGYTPETSALSDEDLERVTTFHELVGFTENLPQGYVLVSYPIIVSETVNRCTLCLEDMRRELASLISTVEEYCDADIEDIEEQVELPDQASMLLRPYQAAQVTQASVEGPPDEEEFDLEAMLENLEEDTEAMIVHTVETVVIRDLRGKFERALMRLRATEEEFTYCMDYYESIFSMEGPASLQDLKRLGVQLETPEKKVDDTIFELVSRSLRVYRNMPE